MTHLFVSPQGARRLRKSKVPLLRNHDDAGVVTRLDAPPPRQTAPRASKENEIPSIVRNQKTSEIGRRQQLLVVRRPKPTDRLRGERRVAFGLKKGPEQEIDVLV